MDSKKLKITDKEMKKEINKSLQDRFALRRMAEKIRKVCGDDYVFVLFDVKIPPEPGDVIELPNLKLHATFRKYKGRN